MKKEKILDTVYRNHFYYESKFPLVILTNHQESFKIALHKVLNSKDINDYVAPLSTFNNEGYLIYPVTYFNFKHFEQDLDVLFIDASYQIVWIEEDVNKDTQINYHGKYYSMIILTKGTIKFLDLKVQDRLRITKYYK